MLLFVYGTLRRGQSNHAELGGPTHARFVRAVITAPQYELVDLGSYPALLEGGSTAVHGELYEVDDRKLEQLDVFEEVPSAYERKSVAIAGLCALDTIAYVMRRETARSAPAIPSGDWCKRASASV